MAKQNIIVELDSETIHDLTALGDPTDVLTRLAFAAADGVRRPGHPKREQTNQSLRVEREKSDVAIAKERASVEGEADHVVQIARQRADLVVQTALDDAHGEGRGQSTAIDARSERARTVLEHERSDADAVLAGERVERRSYRADFLVVERDSTDKDLIGERAHADTLIVDQREANERMVRATIRAEELALEADAARARAEKGERELHAVGEFREMFIAMLGHDLRNPLGSINMSASLLLRPGRLGEHDAEMAARIIRSSQRMSRMITQLLDLTRARLGGGLPIDRAPADLGEVCRNAVEEFEAPIQLEVEGDLTGSWDQDRLAEVLSNLAGNAIEHAAPGTVVSVNAHGIGAEVVIEVSNQGDPIPANVLPFIFEPFRQAQEGRTSATGNLGLGLYIARQIVISHGGTLDAHSDGGTTTFAMRLPRFAA